MTRRKKSKDDETPKTFEESMARLETIVEELERGEIGLEPSLALFEEGVGIARRLEKRLQSAEMTVEKLTRHGDGTGETEPLELHDEPGDDAP